MSVRRANLLERLRDPAKTTTEQKTVLLTGSVCADMREAATEIEKLKAALEKAEEADEFHAKCPECEGEGAPEECGKCFPLADDARLMRWAALGIHQPFADAE